MPEVTIICKQCSKPYLYHCNNIYNNLKKFCSACSKIRYGEITKLYKKKPLLKCEICFKPISNPGLIIHVACLLNRDNKKTTKEEYKSSQRGAWDEASMLI